MVTLQDSEDSIIAEKLHENEEMVITWLTVLSNQLDN